MIVMEGCELNDVQILVTSNAHTSDCEDIILEFCLMHYTALKPQNTSVHTLCYQDIRTPVIVSKSVGILKSTQFICMAKATYLA